MFKYQITDGHHERQQKIFVKTKYFSPNDLFLDLRHTKQWNI